MSASLSAERAPRRLPRHGRHAWRSAATLAMVTLTASCGTRRLSPSDAEPGPTASLPGEARLRDLVQLTHGGENAEAYWSWDGSRLVFQSRRGEEGCDRIRTFRADGSAEREVVAEGANTCAFFLPGDERIVFSSTRAAGPPCPPPVDRSQGYVWPLHDHDVYSVRLDGGDLRRLTDTPGYDAESTISATGRIVFTSVRDGDLDIYSMDERGGDVRRLTDEPGYDGGAFISRDGTRVVYRAHHPQAPEELAEYRRLLAQGVVKPGRLEIWIMNADGTDRRQLTHLGAAAFAPCFTPDAGSVLFSSNHEDPAGREFDLYLLPLGGGPLERVTHAPSFDGFPMFSPDGTRLAFCSNRGGRRPGETNVFVAEWVAAPSPPR